MKISRIKHQNTHSVKELQAFITETLTQEQQKQIKGGIVIVDDHAV